MGKTATLEACDETDCDKCLKYEKKKEREKKNLRDIYTDLFFYSNFNYHLSKHFSCCATPRLKV